MTYQVLIKYHASLMDDYYVVDWHNAKTRKEAENWIERWFKHHLPKEEPDPENPISDLYDSEIQEVE